MVARLGDLGASQQWLLAGAGRPARVTDAPYRRRVPGAGAAALRCTESGLVPVRRGTYYSPGGPQGSGYGHYDHVHVTTTPRR